MMTIEFLRKMFAYDAWANEQTFASLAHGPEVQKARDLFSHIVTSQSVWLARVEGRDTTGTNVFPGGALDESRKLAEKMRESWDRLLSEIAPDDIDRIVSYRNLRGESYETPLADILMHVVNHSTYHRGQIASALKAAGGAPAVTDYVAFTRV